MPGRWVGIRKKKITKPFFDPNTEAWSNFLCFPAKVTYLSHALNKAGELRMPNKVPASKALSKGKGLAFTTGNFQEKLSNKPWTDSEVPFCACWSPDVSSEILNSYKDLKSQDARRAWSSSRLASDEDYSGHSISSNSFMHSIKFLPLHQKVAENQLLCQYFQ